MDLGEQDTNNHWVDTKMSNTRIESEVVVALNNPEEETIPLQRLQR